MLTTWHICWIAASKLPARPTAKPSQATAGKTTLWRALVWVNMNISLDTNTQAGKPFIDFLSCCERLFGGQRLNWQYTLQMSSENIHMLVHFVLSLRKLITSISSILRAKKWLDSSIFITFCLYWWLIYIILAAYSLQTLTFGALIAGFQVKELIVPLLLSSSLVLTALIWTSTDYLVCINSSSLNRNSSSI